MIYEYCLPYQDPDTWHTTPNYKYGKYFATLVEEVAEHMCEKDPGCYRGFTEGQEVWIREEGTQDIQKFEVTVRYAPVFEADWKE